MSVGRRTTAVTAAVSPLQMLFRIAFRHEYYNAEADRCPDFRVVPTAATAALINSVGLLVQPFDDGFGVVLPRNRAAALDDVLTRDPDARLGFLLILDNPDFIGFTALPIDTSPARQALHVSNLDTSGSGKARQFGSTATIDAAALLPVTGASIAIDSAVAGIVTATDLLGAAVASVAVAPGMPASLSLAGQPYGAYAIAGTPHAAWTGPAAVAFMPTAPLAFGVIDLVLVQPADGIGSAAAFPIAVGHATNPVAINLSFAARPTYWTYYVVAKGASGFAPDLAISGGDMTFTRAPAQLPNGDRAVRFTADRPQAMRQRAAAKFSLAGQHRAGNGQRGDISINHLPTAPTAPVWPARQAGAGVSEIYVYL